MEIEAYLKDIKPNKLDKEAVIELFIPNYNENNIQILAEIGNDAKLDVKIEKHRKRRSLNANSYFWELLTRVCQKQNLDLISEYRRRVKELGICRQFKIMTEQVNTFIKIWEDRGVAWFCETVDTEYIAQQEFKIINSYYGSSSYNSKQMGRLIDNIVQDCQAIGIETRPEEEIKSLLESWGENGV